MARVMRTTIALSMVTALGLETALTIREADAAPQKKARPKPRSAVPDFASFDRGGAPGCFGGDINSNAAAIARRFGAQPCEPAPQPAETPSANALDVTYETDSATVFRSAPGDCALFLRTPRGAIMRVAYRADGTTGFAYVRPGLTLDPATPSYPALFQFDASHDLTGYLAVDTQFDDEHVGFKLVNAGAELLDQWAVAQTMTIRLGTVSARPFDTIALGETAAAIAHLRECAALGDAPAARRGPNFTGTYKLKPQQDDMTAEISPLGGQRYKVSLTWGGMTAGGNYNSDGWEGIGIARGNVLNVERQDRDDGSQTCTFTVTPSPRPIYRLQGCGVGDGIYTRTKARP